MSGDPSARLPKNVRWRLQAAMEALAPLVDPDMQTNCTLEREVRIRTSLYVRTQVVENLEKIRAWADGDIVE